MRRRHPRDTRGWALALLFAASSLVASCGGDEPARREPKDEPSFAVYAEPPNVLLVTVDTLRADHLGCYGYRRTTSPRLDALAAEGVRFDRAYSVAGTTLPSHLSIMTGLLPHQHGYVANKGAIKGPFQPSEGRRTVAQYFGDAGYTTAAFISGTTVKKTTGIDVGFETFDQPETINRIGSETIDGALHWLELFAEFGREKKSGEPRRFFLWVHLWDPHEPNTPVPPYDTLFGRDGVVESLLAERRVDLAKLAAGFSDKEKARMFFPDLLEPLMRGQDVQLPELTREHLLKLYDLYDGDVRYTDDQIGRVLDLLDTSGLARETIVCVTADHGQALGQHDWLEHGRIQAENIHVPLIVRFPGTLVPQPSVVERVVSSIDLMPTIVARLGREVGAPFLAQAEGEDALAPAFERPYAFSHRSERDRDNWEPGRKFGLTLDGWKYYRLEEGEDQLFDLSTDPGELVDVAAQHPDRVRRMRRVVEGILASRPAGEQAGGELSPEEAAAFQRELDALGYTGG